MKLTTKQIIISLVIVTATCVGLYLMGRLPWCECGHVKIWHGGAYTTETSQHLFDPYTFTHVSHGLIFYALLWVVAKKQSIENRFLMALGIEGGWELLENTPLVINRYREATASLDYFGDTVVNAFGDILAMIVGFVAVALMPTYASIILFILLELFLAWLIRDNLILNLIMLTWPIESIRDWQTALYR